MVSLFICLDLGLHFSKCLPQSYSRGAESTFRKVSDSFKLPYSYRRLVGVSNGPIQFESARKIWPVLELLAKLRWVLTCSCSQNFWKCSRVRIFVKNSLTCSVSIICILKTKTDTENVFPEWETGKHWGNMRPAWMFLGKCFLVHFVDVNLSKLTGVQSHVAG